MRTSDGTTREIATDSRRCFDVPRLAMMLVMWGLLVGPACRPSQRSTTEEDEQPKKPQEALRVLVVEDEALASAMQRHWEARAARPLDIVPATAEEIVAEDRGRLAADVVIYPSGLLGTLAERRWLHPVPDEVLQSARYRQRDVFELIRLREVRWGNTVMAVPLGSPTFVLLYRRDIFEKLSLKPPATWEEYDALASRLEDRTALGKLAPPNDQPWQAVAEPWGPGWAGQVLLARAASRARHRSQFSTLFEYRTMTPLIDRPPFVEALREMESLAPRLGPEALEWSPRDARAALLNGRCAMAITWASAAEDKEIRESAVAAAFAQLPGSTRVYNYRSDAWEKRPDDDDPRVTLLGVSGRLASLTNESRQPQAAAQLLVWIAGELSEDVCSQSPHTTLFRESHLARVARWIGPGFDDLAATSYGETVQEALERSGWVCSPRIPGRSAYLAALDDAVRKAVEGDDSADAALRAAAEQWQTITDGLGRASQQKAYMRSVGLEP